MSFPYDDADEEEIEEQSQEDDMRNDTQKLNEFIKKELERFEMLER